MSTLEMAVCVWVDSYTVKDGMRIQIVFYSVSSEDNCSFLIVEAEFGVTRIRISDRVDRMITEHYGTGEVKVFDMAEVFTYSHFKEKLASTLQAAECTKLTKFFKIPKDQTDAILRSDKASENVMLALEEKARSHYKEDIKKLNEEIKTLRMTSEEERKELKTSWTIHKAPDGRIYYHNSVTKEIRWENPESGQRAEENLQNFPSVSEKLSKANCVKLATYFNFPAAKIDQIKNDFETPGITLFDILKERHIVNIHNVMSLKEALKELELKDISDTLVTPYQRKIDRLRFEQEYLS